MSKALKVVAGLTLATHSQAAWTGQRGEKVMIATSSGTVEQAIERWNDICLRLGCLPTVKVVEWSEVFAPRLLGEPFGEWDVLDGNIFVKPDRALAVSFTQSIATDGSSVGVKVAGASLKLADLDKRKTVIGSTKATANEALARAQFPKATHVTFLTNPESHAALLAGEVDAIVEDTSYLPEGSVSLVDLEVFQIALALEKGDPVLARLNGVLSDILSGVPFVPPVEKPAQVILETQPPEPVAVSTAAPVFGAPSLSSGVRYTTPQLPTAIGRYALGSATASSPQYAVPSKYPAPSANARPNSATFASLNQARPQEFWQQGGLQQTPVPFRMQQMGPFGNIGGFSGLNPGLNQGFQQGFNNFGGRFAQPGFGNFGGFGNVVAAPRGFVFGR